MMAEDKKDVSMLVDDIAAAMDRSASGIEATATTATIKTPTTTTSSSSSSSSSSTSSAPACIKKDTGGNDTTIVLTGPKLFVGNVQSASEGDLIKLFSRFGTVVAVQYQWFKQGLLKGQPRGFAFVEMSSIAEATKAVRALHGQMLRGRSLVVAAADKEPQFKQERWYGQPDDALLMFRSQPSKGQHQRGTVERVTGQKRIQQVVSSNIDENIKRLKATLAATGSNADQTVKKEP